MHKSESKGLPFLKGREKSVETQTELISGRESETNFITSKESVTSDQPALREIIKKLDESGDVGIHLPNSMWLPDSSRRIITRHGGRVGVTQTEVGKVDFDELSGRGGEVDMMLVTKGLGAEYKDAYYTESDYEGSVTGGQIRPEFMIYPERQKGAAEEDFTAQSANEAEYIPEGTTPDVILLTPHSYSRPYGAQTLERAENSLRCSEELAGSGIKYTPVLAVLPMSHEIGQLIADTTRRAGMPISPDMEQVELAQELILYPKSTVRGSELIYGDRDSNSQSPLIDQMFENQEAKDAFIEKMADDLYWLLNWPARDTEKVGEGMYGEGTYKWRRFLDIHLNYSDLGQDLQYTQSEHREIVDPIKRLENRKRNSFSVTPQDSVPFVLKDLIIDPENGCFVTDFESSKIEECGDRGIMEAAATTIRERNILWVYGVLYEFLTMSIAILDSSVKSDLTSLLLRGRSPSNRQEITDYNSFYNDVKNIYTKILRQLADKKEGGIEIALSEDEDEFSVTLNYSDKSIKPTTYNFALTDFIKI